MNKRMKGIREKVRKICNEKERETEEKKKFERASVFSLCRTFSPHPPTPPPLFF
jgi:hypothetical protein